MNAVGVVNK